MVESGLVRVNHILTPKKEPRGFKYARRKSRSLVRKFEKGIETAVDRILDKLNAGENLRDEEIRLLKNYQGLLDGIRSQKRTEKIKALPDSKLKDILDKMNKFSKLGGDKVMISADYYKCPECDYWHKNADKCPYIIAENKAKKQKKKEVKEKDD